MSGPIDLRGRFDIETPEQVSFRLERAGLGSRILAAVIDTLLLGAAYLFVIVGLLVATGAARALDESGPLWIFGLLILVLTFLLWTYYIAFEVGWNGQTPGKRALGIRVVGDNGVPATATQIVVRNLMRLVDFQLGYAVGMIAIFLSREEKRIGDLVAGTIVVTERRRPVRDASPAGASGEAAVAAADTVSRPLRDLVHDFRRRAPELDADTRARIAGELGQRVAAELGVPPPGPAAAESELARWVP